MAKLLITSVPSGYAQQPDSVGDTGPSDLAKAIRDDGSPDARAVLTQDGFVVGYQRLWRTADKREIIVFLFTAKYAASAPIFLAWSTVKAMVFSW